MQVSKKDVSLHHRNKQTEIMTTQSVLKLAKKIRNGCERTAYIKAQAKKADYFLIVNGLTEMEIETEENCYSMLVDIFGSVIKGEV